MNFIKNLLNKDSDEKPYFDLYGTVPTHLEYPDVSMYELLYEAVKKYPNYTAIEYFGRNITYKKFYDKIETTAEALKVIGVKEKDRVTICMPNTPEAIIMFYAVNMVGAVANMIHPLSSENEIEFYMDVANSKYILTINLFAEKVITAATRVNAKKIIISDISDGMFMVMRKLIDVYNYASKYFKAKDEIKIEYNDVVIKWTDFVNLGYGFDGEYKVPGKGSDEAVILYSGGTTGKPKGVRLSNLNFNALGMQSFKMCDPAKAGDSALVILPIFHGFGLGVSVHTELISGMQCVLIPQFKPSDFAKLIKRHHPAFLIGVPTMYEALTQNEDNSKYLKSVTSCICGGDILQLDLRNRVNDYLANHGSNAQIRVGYGLTESTAACILTPRYYFKEGGIGIPMPDMNIKIIKPYTTKELRPNRKGEICISGPTIMLGYLNEPEETANTIKLHPDGKMWLHTGDLGYKDKEGLVFFTSRLKRIIVTSGYNVYPSYMEKIIDSHPAIEACVVVGIPHPYKKQVPVACIVLRKNFVPSAELTEDIKRYCAKSIAKYAMPYRYEYIKTVPKTLVGKVNYKKLEEECTRKYGK
jgi:long-chain acyl-CoA synthetase